MKSWISAFLVMCLSAGLVAAEPTSSAPLRAGAATSNITPELGAKIIGGFVPFPATGVHDELHARCLVLDDGKTRLALVVCDLLGLHRSVSIEARRLIEESTGIPPAQVMISGTHTHSATSALGDSRYVSEQPLDAYQQFLARRIADGVRRAVNALRPAQVGFVTAEAPEHVFNRRWVMKEGTAPVNPFGKVDKVKMNPPGGSPNLVEPAGPTDPTVSILALREPEGRLISVFAAYSLHYVGGVGNGEISADYYGMFCSALARLNGAKEDESLPFVPILANGTSGDINNVNFRTPRPSSPPYAQMRKVAEDVAGKVQAALAGVEWKDRADLQARFRELELSWRVLSPETLAWAKEKLPNADVPSVKADLPRSMPGGCNSSARRKIPHASPCRCSGSETSASGPFPARRLRRQGWSSKSAARSSTHSWWS
ncbi:neutral/alkaline non-lysosomal ceramidase N-terminal domain-containing protein [Verrucomicrobium spinosum]|uniref:neutral/alkaline non-lysosomal ceramidase N-terminal domain-containing protein n=1 Tax=Verrucomicrobium spinosum TaxID=2736 RepID=UPI000AB819A7|nr:neutral/alkaline non-lysosomal ceramidase N-terminal domain-containing protein [Verrucomicrobium spinosum]